MKSSKQQKKREEQLFVSDAVLLTFRQLYPTLDLHKVTWSWEVPYKIYEAEFELDDKEYEVEIAVTGQHILTEIEIESDQLPEAVRKSMRKTYPNQSVDEVERVEYSNGLVYYEIELEKGEKTREVFYREDGLFIGESEHF